MGNMRKTLLGFMTLLMLTPVLVCAMSFCPMQSAQAAQGEPCHQTGDNKGIMLSLDCMGVDLFQNDTANDIQPDLNIDSVDYTYADLTAGWSTVPDNIHGIRGPPERTSEPYARPSLILTTQRFRI